MHKLFRILCPVTLLALVILATAAAQPPSLLAQLTPMEREQVREETRREIERRQLREDEWRLHNERYFGSGVTIERYPGEAYDVYAGRVRERCNAQWTRCSTMCAAALDPATRTVCAANCNNELYECTSGF